ncbi:polyprenol phosphomannose-dependent alpha 1,6 mannosyltransferase MptB [Nonomuraea soli]|uniref:DUF2029 domain-containing protein n=1 Tax=Nonomuraea soli TaxID=1032476 RepID=A0A7W0HQ91_9ACTN|nr:polyprenol phosphomannose-dependent alpha 1,6 mannosyltransferase MptB [Nonomuraea soli]MBA2891668.1 hypothetical protein [Nonomuraea soli]
MTGSRAALVAMASSVLLTITIGLLGPSAVVPALPGETWQPPYSLAAHPSPYLVIVLSALAIVTGGIGLLAALVRPPAIDPRRLVTAGYAAAGLLAFLPPSGSADHLNYAAYGRMVTLGLNPYLHGAIDLPGDPVAGVVEEPWREEPSVYGPVATAVQALASWIGGDSVKLTIFVLAVVNAAAFIGTGLLIDRFTRHDPAMRLRGAVLWTANPLLIYQLVAGMHIDTLAIAFMVAALLSRAHPVGGGALLGLGVAVKLNAGLVALGPAWELRRRPGRLALMAGTALAVAAVGYVIAGSAAFDQLGRTSKAISFASPWKLVQGWLQDLFGSGAYRAEIQVGALLLMALLAWRLLRASGGEADAPRVAAVLAIAYLVATPYILPWYDGLAFGLLALVAASALDRFMAAHLAILSLGYLPARIQEVPDDLEWLRTVVRAGLVPWALLVLTAALVWWAWRAGARAPRRPAPAAPRP